MCMYVGMQVEGKEPNQAPHVCWHTNKPSCGLVVLSPLGIPPYFLQGPVSCANFFNFLQSTSLRLWGSTKSISTGILCLRIFAWGLKNTFICGSGFHYWWTSITNHFFHNQWKVKLQELFLTFLKNFCFFFCFLLSLYRYFVI